jgi:protease-4
MRHLTKRLFLITIGLNLLNLTAYADPTGNSLQMGTSLSHNDEARSLFVNPAAMGYETELNGSSFATAFSYGSNVGLSGDYSLGITYGFFGIGLEEYGSSGLRRYQMGFGAPLSSRWFAGWRLGLVRGTVSQTTLDFGIQYRPKNWLAFGLVTNRVNQPDGVPCEIGMGITLAPFQSWQVFGDLSSYTGSSFLRTNAYQVGTRLDLIPGFRLWAGYHSQYQLQVGLQIDFMNLSVGGHSQMSNERSLVTHIQIGSRAHKTFIQPVRVARFSIDKSLVQTTPPRNLFAAPKKSLLELLQEIEEVRKDPFTVKVVFIVDNFPLGLASAQEVSESILRLRQSGKKVEAHLGNAGLKEYLIASAASTINMEPEGELHFLGLKQERYFIKGTLDLLGVEPEFLAKGKYKSAPEMFSQTESSPAHKESTRVELSAFEGSILELLQKNRNLKKTDWDLMLEKALWSASDAKASRLIDGIQAESELSAELKKSFQTEGYFETKSRRVALPPQVAVVVANGSILSQKMKLLNTAGESQITPEGFSEKMEQALNNPRAEAILVRINSPGGEVLASHQLAMLVEEAARKKTAFYFNGRRGCEWRVLHGRSRFKNICRQKQCGGIDWSFSRKIFCQRPV